MNIPLRQYLNLLTNYLAPQKRRVAWLAIVLLSSITLKATNPLILRYFIDTAISGGAERLLFILAVGFMGAALMTQALSVVATYFGENVAWTATNSLRVDLVKHCLNLDLSFHKSRTPGELIERVDGDVNVLSRFFSQFTINIVGNIILLLSILVILFFTDWRAGFALTLFSLAALSALIQIRFYAIHPWTAYRQTSAEFFGFLGEYFAGIEDIQANGAISYVMHHFYQIIQGWLIVYHKARLAGTFLWGTSVGLFILGNAIALAVSTYLWTQQAITIGTVYLLFHYSNLLRAPIARIREELEDLQKVEASIYRIQELLQIQPQLSAGGNRSLPKGALSVTFEKIWFSYEQPLATDRTVAQKQATNDITSDQQITRDEAPIIESPIMEEAIFKNEEHWTLKNLCFHLPAGQVLGVLGRTGSGKTTLARLLLRLYGLQFGTIRLGSMAIDATPLRKLPQHVGMVTQDVQLFQATVRNNLTLFNPKISDQQILEVLDELGLLTWLQSLPLGLNTHLGVDNGGLSAGQAQLLAFARIFLKDPGLVILDEASSRLDPFTESVIERAVDRLLQGRTSVIIAHRLKTVQRADQILILENGKIVEYGPRELLENDVNSRFFQLLQTGLMEVLA